LGKFFVFLFIVVTAIGLPAQAVFASTTDGTISGYAWSSQIGWINFGTTNGNTHITDSVVTGYAWNENMGRINLDPTNSGVVNNSEGTLSGKAWCEGTGWINFSGVTVSSSGVFSGTATGDNNVSINFNCANCNVTTDWRPASTRSSGGGGGSVSGGGGGGETSGTYDGPFGIVINNENQYTNSKNVTLSLKGGVVVDKMMVSDNVDFANAFQELFSENKNWVLPGSDGLKTVYAKFYNTQGLVSPIVSANIILDTQPPLINLGVLKKSYDTVEQIAITGTAEPGAQVIFLLDGYYGIVPSDQWGNWVLPVGNLGIGNHQVEVFAKDLAGNASPVIKAGFSVYDTPIPYQPPVVDIFKKLTEGIQFLFPQFFKPKELPKVAITVPQITPPAFKGAFHYISTMTLARLVLQPLPSDVKLLAQKFPQVQKTFNEVGVNKITDLQKLSNANLKLPNLTETVLPKPTIAVGKFAVPKGVPIEKLSAIAKNSIPSEIVFAKVAGGLVDLNVALSINNQGKPVQTIKVLSSQHLQLVVRTEQEVRKMTGYVVFKSKKYNSPSVKSDLNTMSASLLFANPSLAALAEPSIKIPIEGATQKINTQEFPDASTIEKRLVISEFEYQDSGNGVYISTIQTPVVDGEYEIITVIDYVDGDQEKEIKLITLIDPEGYIYEKNGDMETRIAGAIASLYWLNPESKQYELWPAKEFQQENPQTTDIRGTYSFLVPEGYYYLKVDSPGYLSYDGKPFEVKEGSGIHINIELKTKYWFLNIVDWKTILLVAVVLMLLYNFYRDKIREKQKNNIQVSNIQNGIK